MRHALGVILLLVVGSANAANVTWTVDLLFSDGYTGSGTFNYDADTNTYSNIDIIVQYDDPSGQGYYDSFDVFTPWQESALTEADSNQVAFIPFYDFPDGYEYLWLFFSSPLTNSGGEIALELYSGFFFQYLDDGGYVSAQKLISEGSVSAVPVPAAVYLFGSGLGLLGWFRRRQS